MFSILKEKEAIKEAYFNNKGKINISNIKGFRRD